MEYIFGLMIILIIHTKIEIQSLRPFKKIYNRYGVHIK